MRVEDDVRTAPDAAGSARVAVRTDTTIRVDREGGDRERAFGSGRLGIDPWLTRGAG